MTSRSAPAQGAPPAFQVSDPKPVSAWWKAGNHEGDAHLALGVTASTRGADPTDRFLTAENAQDPAALVDTLVVIDQAGELTAYHHVRVVETHLSRQLLRADNREPLLGILEKPGKAWEFLPPAEEAKAWFNDVWMPEHCERAEDGAVRLKQQTGAVPAAPAPTVPAAPAPTVPAAPAPTVPAAPAQSPWDAPF